MSLRPAVHLFWQIVLVLLSSWYVGLAWAEPVNCGTRPIRLGFYEYGYFYDKGKGIDQDIVDELVRRSGCRIETQVMTRARIWADLADGALDMSVSGIQTPERDRFAWFAPYLTMKNFAIIRGDTAATVQHAADFLAQPRLQFGVVRAFKHGTEQDRWLDQLRTLQRVQESPDAETLFKKLKEHRLDGLFSQPPVYRKLIHDLHLDKDVSIQDWTPGEKGVPHGLILSKKRFSEADAKNWRALLDQMRGEGALRRIYLRYLPAEEVARLLEY